jgi:predicted dehydrogenase
MRVAILGASHWHVSIYYLPALLREGTEVVAIHDPDAAVLERLGADLPCKRYTDFRELLDREQVDLVFAHAPHSHMPAMAAELISRHQPFHMEKPMGVDWQSLAPLAREAAEVKLWNSVALVSRHYGVIEALDQIRAADNLGKPCHYYYRLFGGGPERYKDWGVSWMLDPALSGGGPLYNFGPHVVDLFQYLTGEPVAQILCSKSHEVSHLPVEDLATIWMRTASGVVGIGEVSYTVPEGYERYFSFTTDTLHWGGEDLGQGTLLMREGQNVPFAGHNADTVYDGYVHDVLTRFSAGQPARATIADMLRTLRVLCAAQESSREGELVQVSAAH